VSGTETTQPSPGEPPAIALTRKVSRPVIIVPRISVVIPTLNEGKSLPDLTRQIRKVLEADKEQYEIIFIDDGSNDDSWATIKRLADGDVTVHGLRLKTRAGLTRALVAGLRKARGTIIVTMAADLQDDPKDLPSFIAKLEFGEDVVVGCRKRRRGSLLRRALSRAFSVAARLITRAPLSDFGCHFRAYRVEALRAIPLGGELARFLPAVAAAQGYRVTEIPVAHHERKYAREGREGHIAGGLLDLVGLWFATRHRSRPTHVFGLLGSVLVTLGVALEIATALGLRLDSQTGAGPLLLAGALSVVTGIHLFAIGFLADHLAYQSQARALGDEPPIQEELR